MVDIGHGFHTLSQLACDKQQAFSTDNNSVDSAAELRKSGKWTRLSTNHNIYLVQLILLQHLIVNKNKNRSRAKCEFTVAIGTAPGISYPLSRVDWSQGYWYMWSMEDDQCRIHFANTYFASLALWRFFVVIQLLISSCE